MNPLVSIIIPTYNRGHLIEETLDSIIAQTYTNWECIVVDDGSIDTTAQLLAEYCKKDTRFQFYHRPIYRPKGANTCRNFGFEMSKGDYVFWFDSDDIMLNIALAKFIEKFENDDNVVAVVSKVRKFKNKLKLLNESNIISKNIIDDYLIGHVIFYPSGIIWKKNFLLKQNELYDEAISNLDDWDFNLRMLYEKPKIEKVELPLILYRVHDNSLSKEINKLNSIEIKSEFKAREKHVILLKNNKMASVKILKKFILLRYKYLLRKALLQQSPLKYYLLKQTIVKELGLFYFLDCLKTLVGFAIYSTFNKGYRFIK